MIAIKDMDMPIYCFLCPMCNANNPNRDSVRLNTPFTCDITENALLDVHNIRDKDCPLLDIEPTWEEGSGEE